MASPALAVKPTLLFVPEDVEREPFGAYLADDATMSAAGVVAGQRGWSSAGIRRGGLPTLLRLLAVASPPRFLFVDVEGLPIEEVEAGITEISRLGSAVIALGSINDVNYFRRIMRAGARDYLIKPVDAEMLGEALARLEQPSDGLHAQGRLAAFVGARGGVGSTTLAINAAWILADKLSRRTGLVDMDLYAGNIALALDIEPTRGLREAFDDPERVDEVFLQNAMASFGKYLHVLATEESFDDAVRMSDDKVLRLADTMRANFDMTILDIPRHFVMREPALFSKLNDVVIVSELTLQSLRDVNRLTKLLSARNRQMRIHVVANRATGKPDVTLKEFEAGIDGTLRAVFSYDPKAFATAALKGQSLAGANPKHKIVADLHRFCIELAGVPEEPKQGFFKRRFGRK
jgi:pilus assembly protein CpaE